MKGLIKGKREVLSLRKDFQSAGKQIILITQCQQLKVLQLKYVGGLTETCQREMPHVFSVR